MDDMKRAMYIAARNAIQKDQADFICLVLKSDLKSQGMRLGKPYSDFESNKDVEGFLEELFPEFFQLFDYKFWMDSSYGTEYNLCSDLHTSWFVYNDKERRIRILDLLIDNR